MFQVGDTVNYGTSGVCTVTEHKGVSLGGRLMDCYILKPVYDHSMTISVPCQSQVLLDRMRPLLSKAELMALLHEPRAERDPDPEARRQRYQAALQSGDRHDLLRMVRDIYAERQRRRAGGKHLSGYEDNALREAENILHTEFAYTMGIKPNEVPDFIAQELQNTVE